MAFKTPEPLIDKWTVKDIDDDIRTHSLQGLTPEYKKAVQKRLSQRINPLDYDKVKQLLDKADVDFKDRPDWESKVDFIREGLRDDIDIDEDIADISLKGKNLIGLQSFPEGEPKEKILYSWK